MDLLVVNSNTSQEITDLVHAEAQAVARPGTKVTSLTAAFGPRAIERPEDVVVAAEATIDAIANAPGPVDAAVIACFSDPGLMAVRRMVPFPVIGIAEAAMLHASRLGARFAILTVAPSSVGGIRKLAEEYGMTRQLTGIHALPRGVLESHCEPSRTLWDMARLAQRILDAERPDVLVLGGAITAGMARSLAPDLPVPIIDGLTCAVRQVDV